MKTVLKGRVRPKWKDEIKMKTVLFLFVAFLCRVVSCHVLSCVRELSVNLLL